MHNINTQFAYNQIKKELFLNKLRKMSTESSKSLIINKIKNYYNLKSDKQFADFLGIKPQTLSSWRTRDMLDYDLISEKCKDISMDYILRGVGEIEENCDEKIPLNKKAVPLDKKHNNAEEIGEIKSVQESVVEYISGKSFIDIGNGKMQMFIPLVEQYAYAGYLSGYADSEFLEELPKFSIIVDKHHKGDYKGFNVRGDSMDNNSKHSISNGEVAVGRMIHRDHWKSKLHIFQWPNYVIVHESGIIIKRITHHDVENCLISCESLNLDKKIYPDFDISLTEVYELYNIVQIVRNNF